RRGGHGGASTELGGQHRRNEAADAEAAHRRDGAARDARRADDPPERRQTSVHLCMLRPWSRYGSWQFSQLITISSLAALSRVRFLAAAAAAARPAASTIARDIRIHAALSFARPAIIR